MYLEVQRPVHVQNPLGVRTINPGTQPHAIGDIPVFIKLKIRTKLGRCAVIISKMVGVTFLFSMYSRLFTLLLALLTGVDPAKTGVTGARWPGPGPRQPGPRRDTPVLQPPPGPGPRSPGPSGRRAPAAMDLPGLPGPGTPVIGAIF